MNGKKAKLLRKLAKHKAEERAEYANLKSGTQKILQINRDGSTEEKLVTKEQKVRMDRKKLYKNLKRLYKEHKKGE